MRLNFDSPKRLKMMLFLTYPQNADYHLSITIGFTSFIKVFVDSCYLSKGLPIENHCFSQYQPILHDRPKTPKPATVMDILLIFKLIIFYSSCTL